MAWVVGGTVLALVLGAAGYAIYTSFQHLVHPPPAPGCQVGTGVQALTLDTDQAGIAATIAGVAARDGLLRQAVTIAYAAALQESKLQNLPYGDRDSVGVFQQRPSEGWGPRRDLENPVYATSKFFGALAKVPGYRRMPIYQAAQAVQHSADGQAYQRFQLMATHMAAAFTGQEPHAVWCRYTPTITGTARVRAARLELVRTFGRHFTRATADPGLAVKVGGVRQGWVVATWLVAHAQQFRISTVRYAGYRWTAAAGSRGWVRTVSPAPPGIVELG